MKRENYNKYFEFLELPYDASLAEVRKAYLFLKNLYSQDTIATIPIDDEIPEGRKEEILKQVEEAYHRLLKLFKQEAERVEPPKRTLLPADDFEKELPEISDYSGQNLKQIRQNLHVDLLDIALATKIQVEHLENIENENYIDLPPAVYVRGFVVSYAKALSLDSKKIADDYMNRYEAWKSRFKKKKT